MTPQTKITLLSEELATMSVAAAMQEEKDVSEDVQRALKGISALEAVYEMFENAKAIDVNPSRNEMNMASIAIDQASALLEVPMPKLISAMEAYDGSESKSQIIMEDIKEKMKKIWEAIIQMMKNIWQWFKDKIGDITTGFDALDKRAEKIIEAINSGRVVSGGNGKIDDDNLKSRLYAPGIDGKDIANDYKKYVEGFYGVVNASDEFFNNPKFRNIHANVQRTSELSFLASQKFKKLKPDILEILKFAATTFFNNEKGDLDKANFKPLDNEAEVEYYATPLLLGNLGYYMICPTSDRALNHIRFANYRGREDSLEDLRDLNKAQIATCLSSWKVLKRSRELFKEMETTLNSNLKVITNLNIASFAEPIRAAFAHEQISVVKAHIRIMTASLMFSPTHAIRVTRDVFRLCEMSFEPAAATSSSTSAVPA